MPTVRPAAVAGAFYPQSPQECSAQVDYFLQGQPVTGAAPKVLLVPHAGYIYSGEVAGKAYAQLIPLREKIKRVVLLGPNHRVPLRGIALPSVDFFQSPLGLVPLDKTSMDALRALPFVGVSDQVHAQEHSLEVHLPFLQRALDSFVLVPLVVGELPPEFVAQALELLWGGDETLIVVSTDLSHFLPYEAAVKMDLNTQAAILQLRTDITPQQACGAHPLNGLLKIAAQKSLTINCIAQNNSGDTAGPKDRVVGYGAYALLPSNHLSTLAMQQLLATARAAVMQAVNGKKIQLTDDFIKNMEPSLREIGASFITLKKAGQLRGCIGSLEPHRTLIDDVIHNAAASALSDPRFQRVQPNELNALDVTVSVLTKPELFHVKSEAELLTTLRPNIDGLILQDGHHRATYLPSVWEQLPTAQLFVRELKRKAGLPDDYWSPTMQVWRYQTITQSEKLLPS